MIAHQFICNLCTGLIQSDFHGRIDGRSFRFTEKTPGITDLEPCELGRQGEMHVCQRCWEAVERLKAKPAPMMTTAAQATISESDLAGMFQRIENF